MVKRFSELGKEEKKIVDSEIEGGKAIIKYDDYNEKLASKLSKSSGFGLCLDCIHLRAAVTEFNSVIAKCNEFERMLNSTDPVKECTEYSKRGIPDLWEMKEMAIIIEVKKSKLGFI